MKRLALLLPRHALTRGIRLVARKSPAFVVAALVCGAVSTLGSGCASTYWRNRANDLGDVASVSFDAGLGVRGQVGPLATGLDVQMDLAGFRGGRFFFDRRAFDLEPIGWSVDLLFVSGNFYGCRPTDLVEPYNRTINARGKYQGQYNPLIEGVFVPFWLCGEMLELGCYAGSRPDNPPQALAPCQAKEGLPFLPTWTHIEVAAALGVGFRLGFNPGELLDFLLGFFGVDLYGDDLPPDPPAPPTP